MDTYLYLSSCSDNKQDSWTHTNCVVVGDRAKPGAKGIEGNDLLYEAMLGMSLIVPYYGESAVPTWILKCRYCHDCRDVTRADLRYYNVFIMQRKRDPIINVTVSVR